MSEKSSNTAQFPPRWSGGKTRRGTMLLTLVFLIPATLVSAHYGEVSVIGFSRDGKLAAVRKVETGEEAEETENGLEYKMDIQIWDLAGKKVFKTFPVITQKDTEIIRADMKNKAGNIAKVPRMRRLRARRWKKVNQSLKSMGFRIVKLPKPVEVLEKRGHKGFDLKNNGLVLAFRIYPTTIKRNADKGIGGSFPEVDLVLGRGGKTVTLREKFYKEQKRRLGFAFMQEETMHPRQYFAALYLSPDGMFLVAIDRGKAMVFGLKANLGELAEN